MTPALFDLAEVLPKHAIRRKNRGAKKGTRPVNAKWDEATRVVRLPLSWSPDEIKERFELLHAAIYDAEAMLEEARQRGHGKLSNRFEHVAELVDQLREVLPAGDNYDPFRAN